MLATTGNLVVNTPVTTPGATTLQGSGAIIINAAVTGSPARVLGGAGSDTFTVNVTGPTPATGTLALDGLEGGDLYTINLASPLGSVVSPVTINDTGTTGSDSATVNAADTSNALVVTATAVTSTAGTAVQTVSYAGLEGLTVNTGNGTDNISVTGTAATTPVVINGGSGNDTFGVTAADPATGQHTLLAPRLVLLAGTGTSTLVVNDQFDTTGTPYNLLTRASVERADGMGLIIYATSGTFADVVVQTSQAGNAINVRSTLAAAARTDVQAGSGNDTITVSTAPNGSGTLEFMAGPLFV
jgi:hypothetical protein